MIEMDYTSHLPPYRSLLSPDARYDYSTHRLVPLTPNELQSWSTKLKQKNNHNLSFKTLNTPQSSFKMKYKSLVSDVSRTLTLRLSNANLIRKECGCSGTCVCSKSLPFHALPVEILDYIFFLVDSPSDYKSCMYVSRLFYFFAKPFYYENISFTSSYRLAQFVTYVRINPDVGQYVKSIDLSGIRSGEEEVDEIGLDRGERSGPRLQLENSRVLASWRDWKVKSNPLYSLPQHEVQSTDLTKMATHISASSQASSRYTLASVKKGFRFLKRRRSSNKDKISSSRSNSSDLTRSRSNSGASASSRYISRFNTNISVEPSHVYTPILVRNAVRHPPMNKFLLSYSASKDIPIGYVLHLINVCPNIESFILGGVQLSMDYEVHRSHLYKFATFDLMHNYPKSLVQEVADLMDLSEYGDALSYASSVIRPSIRHSSASSIASFGMNHVKSLLLPFPDMSHIHKSDGKVYLSDLNLKSINPAYLTKINEAEILNAIVNSHGCMSRLRITRDYRNGSRLIEHHLRYVDLSSVVWLTKEMVQGFMREMVECEINEDDEETSKQDLVLNLTNSGMYKNLLWAKLIDLRTPDGCKLAYRILNDSLVDPEEERIRRSRERRGRIGENYL